MKRSPFQELKELWREHENAAFPEELKSEPNNLPIVLADAKIAGRCSALVSSVSLEEIGQAEDLLSSLRVVERVLPHLVSVDAREYCLRLRELGRLFLGAQKEFWGDSG